MKLYTSPTSPYGRLVLLATLPRHELDFAIAYTNPWENPAEIQALNPFSQVPVLQTDSGTVISNSPFILDFLLGHPLRTAEQTATAAFAFSLLDQLVKLFGLQKFKAENTPDHPLTERARAACIRGLAAAPQPTSRWVWPWCLCNTACLICSPTSAPPIKAHWHNSPPAPMCAPCRRKTWKPAPPPWRSCGRAWFSHSRIPVGTAISYLKLNFLLRFFR